MIIHLLEIKEGSFVINTDIRVRNQTHDQDQRRNFDRTRKRRLNEKRRRSRLKQECAKPTVWDE